MEMKNFEAQLKYGKDWEDRFSKFLINKNWFVTPKYLFAEEGAPILIGKNSKYAIPDIDAAKEGKRIWFECKRKNMMKKYPATGYAKRLHENYKKVQEITGDKVFIIFEDTGNHIDGFLHYGNYIDELEKNIFKEMDFNGIDHVLFKYPEAFMKLQIKWEDSV